VLSATIHESCSVAVLDAGDIVYIARVVTRRIMTVAINVGTRFPAYATSMGRVLLAHQPDEWLDDYLAVTQLDAITPKTVTNPNDLRRDLERVRAQGYCVVDQELEIGLRSMAVPIRASSGQVIAAMNVSLHVSRGSIEAARREILPLMQECAGAIETDFGMRDNTRQNG
jgi:IclR family transcriptional regulator, pca regulon regulatory protein